MGSSRISRSSRALVKSLQLTSSVTDPLPSHLPQPPLGPPPSFTEHLPPPPPSYEPQLVENFSLHAKLGEVIEKSVSDKLAVFSAKMDKLIVAADSRFAGLAKELKYEAPDLHFKHSIAAEAAETVSLAVAKQLESFDKLLAQLESGFQMLSQRVLLLEELSRQSLSPVCTACLSTTCRIGPNRIFACADNGVAREPPESSVMRVPAPRREKAKKIVWTE